MVIATIRIYAASNLKSEDMILDETMKREINPQERNRAEAFSMRVSSPFTR